MKLIVAITLTFLSVLQLNCNRKSYCFINTNTRIIYLTDTSKLESVLIHYVNNSSANMYYEFLSPVNKFTLDSMISISKTKIAIQVKTTDFRYGYLLYIDSNDWSNKKVLKFINRTR